MANKISQEIRQKAEQLRSEGKPYKEISSELGVSLVWCKVNLKNTKQLSLEKDKEVIDELCAKSQSKSGVSKYEISKAIHNEGDSIEKLKGDVVKVTQRIRKRSKDNIVRPNWMTPEFAIFVTNSIVTSSMIAEERMREQSEELRNLLLENCETEEQRKNVPSSNSIRSAIASLTFTMTNQSSKAGIILSNWLESLYNTACKLEDRSNGKVPKSKVAAFEVPKELEGMDEICL